MANQVIGEVEIKIDGKEYILKPSFVAINEIESKAGKGVFSIANDISEAKVKLIDMVAIIYGGMLGGFDGDRSKMPFSFEELGDKILSEGYASYVQPATIFFANGLKGREKKSQ